MRQLHTEKPKNIALTPIPHPHTTWVEIDARAFEHNLQNYKAVIGVVELAPVIKSNAYGHGIELIAQLCEKSNTVDRICVVSLSEAVKLRIMGITKPIIVLSILDADLEYAATHDIAVVCYDVETARALNVIGKKHNKKISTHIKVDTGLSRLGITINQATAIIKLIHEMSFIKIQGIFSHFAESESEDLTFTNHQISLFTELLNTLENNNIHIPLRHISCSAALTGYPKSHFTLCRAGIGMYGLWPSEANKAITTQHHPSFTLQPVLTWKTKIIQLKEIAAGSFVGYDRTHCVARNTKIAVLPVGYWDGYDRGLSNKGQVLVGGTLAPIVGRVAMNLMMVDVTCIPNIKNGDEVTLLGNHTGITAYDLAHHAGTINYEIMTRINPLLPRVSLGEKL
jgi:alanine racemase